MLIDTHKEMTDFDKYVIQYIFKKNIDVKGIDIFSINRPIKKQNKNKTTTTATTTTTTNKQISQLFICMRLHHPERYIYIYINNIEWV